VTERKLDRLNGANSSGLAFQRLWQKNCELVEGFVGDLQDQIDDIAAALAAANLAQSTANAVKITDKISASTVIPADVLSASDAGTDASIVVADHVRLYGDATRLSVIGATITGLTYATDYGVYYDDPTCADTTPTYAATATLSNSLNNYASGRHFVGIITTPASGGGSTSGGSVPQGTDPTFHNRFNT
jgi:hypothetical protein